MEAPLRQVPLYGGSVICGGSALYGFRFRHVPLYGGSPLGIFRYMEVPLYTDSVIWRLCWFRFENTAEGRPNSVNCFGRSALGRFRCMEVN
jgi:hypothetical protein